jgi:hypothetical protein
MGVTSRSRSRRSQTKRDRIKNIQSAAKSNSARQRAIARGGRLGGSHFAQQARKLGLSPSAYASKFLGITEQQLGTYSEDQINQQLAQRAQEVGLLDLY